MKRPLCFCALIMTAIVFIYLEFFLSDLTENGFGEQDGSYVELEGIVSKKEIRPDFSGKAKTVIYLIPREKIKGNFKYVECCLCGGSYEPAIGEKVFLGGELKAFFGPRNPGEFDSRLYYSTLKIAYRINDAEVKRTDGKQDHVKEALFKVRIYFEGVLDRCLDKGDSAVMKAILLGDKACVDKETKDMYKNSGIIHILAVSGLHISIIGMGIYRFLRKIKVYALPGAAVSITVMLLYGSMCGMSTSAFRAICMFTVRLLAPLLGRTYDILTGLALAEILLLLDQPMYLYNSGFLFSFGAILGVTLIAPRMRLTVITDLLANAGLLPDLGKYNQMNFRMKFADEEISLAQKVCEKLLEAIKSGLGIALMTLPVYSCFYYTYPIHSLFLNLIVIPLMSILMVTGLITMAVGALLLEAGTGDIHLIGSLVHIMLCIYKTLCSSTFLTHNLTWYMGHSDKWQVVLYYGLLIGVIVLSSEQFTLHYHAKLVLTILAVFTLTFRLQPQLEVNMIDVGQGDGIVLSIQGKNILIDGGSTSKKNVGRYQIIPFLKFKAIGELDAIVLTHEDEDHLSGIMDILDDMEKGGILVKELILPEVAEVCRGDNYHKLEKRAKELKIPVYYINKGEKFSFGGAEFICINPSLNMAVDGANAYSTVLFMKYGSFTALFTGDVEAEGQENIKRVIDKNPELFNNLTILKVAHHGSRYTTDEEFLGMLNPKIALISCGIGNSYGHPHDEVLERLEQVGAEVYRTDELGAISVVVLGPKVRITSFLPQKQHTAQGAAQ